MENQCYQIERLRAYGENIWCSVNRCGQHLFGFSYAKRYSERPRQLRLLKSALQSLEAEIMYGHTPLSEAAERLVKQMPKPLNWIFQSFAKN